MTDDRQSSHPQGHAGETAGEDDERLRHQVEMQAGRATRRQPQSMPWEEIEPESPEEQGTWLISYADLLTLLLTMFVILVAYATFEPDRYERSEALLKRPDQGAVDGEQAAPVQASESSAAGPVDQGMPVEERARLLQRAIRNSGIGEQVEARVVEGGLELQIRDRVLFPQAADRISDQGFAVLDDIATLLKRSDYDIAVEGHTDNVPISTLRFPSNWELSAARAARVLRYLYARGVAADRMRAVGYADTRPVASNDTPEGRAANRRVSIVLDMES